MNISFSFFKDSRRLLQGLQVKMEEDTAEGGAGRQSATATPSRTPAAGRAPNALPSRAPDALALGVHVSSEHCGADIAIVKRAATLAGLAVGGMHEHELALD